MLDPHICMKIYPKKFDVTNFDNFALTKKKKKSRGKVLQEQNLTRRAFYDNNSN